jgi:hypothetical protein
VMISQWKTRDGSLANIGASGCQTSRNNSDDS